MSGTEHPALVLQLWAQTRYPARPCESTAHRYKQYLRHDKHTVPLACVFSRCCHESRVCIHIHIHANCKTASGRSFRGNSPRRQCRDRRWQLWAWHRPEGLSALWGAEVGYSDVDKTSSLQPKANTSRLLSYYLYFFVLFPMCPWLAWCLLCIPADSELAVTLLPLFLSTGKYSCAPPHLAVPSFKIRSLISKIIIVK